MKYIMMRLYFCIPLLPNYDKNWGLISAPTCVQSINVQLNPRYLAVVRRFLRGSQVQVQERTSSVGVATGLHVLRYLSLGRPVAPIVLVRPSIGSETSLRLIPAPGQPENSLTPGCLMVVSAERPATLQITVRPSVPGGSLEAKVQLEALSANPSGETSESQPVLSHEPAADAPEEPLGVLAHVARRGDVRQPLGQWLCGPEAPAPIEGVQITGLAGRDIALEHRVWVAGEQQWTSWRRGEEYGGSRGRARPLVAVHFRLTGAAASRYRLHAEALFLGSAVMRKTGVEAELRSAAGLDPLVGLKLQIEEQQAVEARPATADKQILDGEAKTRVRVFRATRDRKVA
jgi:hypothetical protein